VAKPKAPVAPPAVPPKPGLSYRYNNVMKPGYSYATNWKNPTQRPYDANTSIAVMDNPNAPAAPAGHGGNEVAGGKGDAGASDMKGDKGRYRNGGEVKQHFSAGGGVGGDRVEMQTQNGALVQGAGRPRASSGFQSTPQQRATEAQKIAARTNVPRGTAAPGNPSVAQQIVAPALDLNEGLPQVPAYKHGGEVKKPVTQKVKPKAKAKGKPTARAQSLKRPVPKKKFSFAQGGAVEEFMKRYPDFKAA
jgi:hypothetical protein